MDLTVMMPVYNEAGNLRGVFCELEETFLKCAYQYEFLFVDDCSQDESRELLEQFRLKYPKMVRVIHHQTNQGIMGSLDTLMHNAHGEFLFFNSTDRQFEMKDCLRMMALRDQFDLITGVREKKLYDPWRKVVSFLFNRIPLLLFGVSTQDAGSIKLYRREISNLVMRSHGPFREAERMIRASKLGYRLGTIPINHLKRRAGRASGSDFKLVMESALDVVRCFWSIQILRQKKCPKKKAFFFSPTLSPVEQK